MCIANNKNRRSNWSRLLNFKLILGGHINMVYHLLGAKSCQKTGFRQFNHSDKVCVPPIEGLMICLYLATVLAALEFEAKLAVSVYLRNE